jgi:hypothetical protein
MKSTGHEQQREREQHLEEDDEDLVRPDLAGQERIDAEHHGSLHHPDLGDRRGGVDRGRRRGARLVAATAAAPGARGVG